MKVQRDFEAFDWDRCRCGHAYLAHEHYRPGKDCGYCGEAVCGRFEAVTPERWWREIIKNFKRGWRHG